jgi:hypothetical protein
VQGSPPISTNSAAAGTRSAWPVQLAVGGGEAERHIEADEQLAQFVGVSVLEAADDVEQVEDGVLGPGPLGQERTDGQVEILLSSHGLLRR